MSRLKKQMRDFVEGGQKLFWHRQSMFIGATLLTGYYFSFQIALFCYAVCVLTEVFDLYISRRILGWNNDGKAAARHYLNLLAISTIFSAGAVSLFALVIAGQEGPSAHFTPLLFLLSAALFAAMNNHQLVRVLLLRLGIYGTVAIYIPIHDIWVTKAPFQSDLWLNFLTVVFVLYVIVESAVIFLRLYQRNLRQMETLRVEHDRAMAANTAKTQFLAMVTHELRTPLTSIKGSIDLIDSGHLGDVPDKMAPVFAIASKNSMRLNQLINELLDVQKIESGAMIFHPVPVDLAAMVQDSVNAIGGYTSGHNVTVTTKIAEGSFQVSGDYGRLLQIMANVLSNAIKFSDKSDVVEVTLERIGEKARISVSDNGIGIPAEARETVFEKFSQVDASDRRSYGGTGLGLNITKQLLKLHQGSIDFTSEMGIGTTFFIDLDICDQPPQEIVVAAEPANAATGAKGLPIPAVGA
jgi:signal transduction histidine kinase